MEDVCPIFDPMMSLVEVSCSRGCVMILGGCGLPFSMGPPLPHIGSDGTGELWEETWQLGRVKTM